ncbi:MAG: circularly permuted type 2 ATP-grasp protein [Acidimicrobiia bacterium]
MTRSPGQDAGALGAPWWDRAAITALLGTLDVSALAARQRAGRLLLAAEGAGQAISGRADPARGTTTVIPPFDPVPVCIGGGRWRELQAGIAQRARLADALAADLHGPQRSLTTATLPPEGALARLHPALVNLEPGGGHHVVLYAADVVATDDGFAIAAEHLDGAVGAGYARLYRGLSHRLVAEPLHRHGVETVHAWYDVLRHVLASMAATATSRSRRGPRTVMMTEGPNASSWFEQSWLASRLGLHLVEPADLVVRDDHVWLRSLGTLEPVDVILRGLPTASADPLELGVDGPDGVAALVLAARRSAVALANALGAEAAAGLADAAHGAPLCKLLLGERLKLPWLPNGTATHSASTAVDGEWAETPVTLRLFALVDQRGATVMPGGYALAGGYAKDIWILPDGATAPKPTQMALGWSTLPQVDLRNSLPTRTAESLWWLGRNSESAEAAIRAAAALLVHSEEEEIDEDHAVTNGLAGLRAVSGGGLVASTAPPIGSVRDELVAALAGRVGSAADCLAHLVINARGARGYLSTATWRVVDSLDRARSTLEIDAAKVEPYVLADILDEALVGLVALAGLAAESMVRGPGWGFADLGRRVERSLRVLSLLDAALGQPADAAVESVRCGIVLSACDSLIAYRRLHRSDLTRDDTITLLVRDITNPRSVAYQLVRLQEHVAGLPPHPRRGTAVALVDNAIEALLPDNAGRSLRETVLAVRGCLLDFAATVTRDWFTDEGAAHSLWKIAP